MTASGIGWFDSPKWPDFKLYKSASIENVWCGSTDTGRPITPTFVALLSVTEDLTEDEVRPMMREYLDDRFSQAHPNGCPGRH